MSTWGEVDARIGKPKGLWQALREELPTKPYQDLLAAVAYTFSGIVVMTYVLNIVHFRMPDPRKNEPLPDLLHDWVAPLPKTEGSELLYHSLTIWVILAGLHHFRLDMFPPATRFILTWGSSWWIRVFALLATGLPPTDDEYCRHAYPNYPDDFPHPIPSVAYNTFVGVITAGNGNIHCGDLFFSGHTTMITVDAMFMLTYLRQKHKWMVVAFSLLTLLKMFLIIAERRHYTIDVLASAYVSVTLWALLPDHIPAPFRFWSRGRRASPPGSQSIGMDDHSHNPQSDNSPPPASP